MQHNFATVTYRKETFPVWAVRRIPKKTIFGSGSARVRTFPIFYDTRVNYAHIYGFITAIVEIRCIQLEFWCILVIMPPPHRAETLSDAFV